MTTLSPPDAPPVARRPLPTRDYWRRFLAVARIVVGLYFGFEAIRKISQGWLVGGSNFTHTVMAYPSAHGGGVYHSFLTGVVLPRPQIFALLVTLGECAAAISLTLGLLTRLGALIALWLNLNFLFLRGFTSPSANLDRAFVVANILFLVTAVGRRWGLDGRFGDTFAHNPVTRWLAGAQPPDEVHDTKERAAVGASPE